MSFQFKKRPKSITNHRLLQKELFSNNFHELDKALNSTTNLNTNLKMYVSNYIVKQFSFPNKKFHNRISSSQIEKKEKSKLLLLNESVLNTLKKMNISQDTSKKLYQKKKEENNLFLQKFKKLQNLREKISRKKNNSAIIRPANFSIFNDLVKEYRKNDIIIKDDMFKNKDLYKATPIVLKNRQDIDFFYLFNHDKYFRKTNISFNAKNNSENKHDEQKSPKNNIKYEKLKEAIFFKKLISASKKRLNELNKEKIFDEKNDTNNNINEEYIEEKENDYSLIIKKDKEYINELIKTINLLKQKNNYNSEENSKKIKNSINDISLSFDSFSNILSTKRTNIPIQNSFSLIKQSYSSNENKSKNQQFSKKNLFRNYNLNKTSTIKSSSFIKKKENNILKKFNLKKSIKKPNETANISNIKTKFYTINKNKINNNIPKKFDKLLDNLKDTENAYEVIKKMTFTNKEKVFKKVIEYFNSKEINAEKIKNNIKKKEIYNFLDGIKEVINTYNCKHKIESLHASIHKSIPEKMKFELEEIYNLDKMIKGVENMYYLSLLKGQSN